MITIQANDFLLKQQTSTSKMRFVFLSLLGLFVLQCYGDLCWLNNAQVNTGWQIQSYCWNQTTINSVCTPSTITTPTTGVHPPTEKEEDKVDCTAIRKCSVCIEEDSCGWCGNSEGNCIYLSEGVGCNEFREQNCPETKESWYGIYI